MIKAIIHKAFTKAQFNQIFRYLNSDLNLIDVGANIGNFTRLISKRRKIKKAILIEPLLEHTRSIKKSKHCKNIIIINKIAYKKDNQIIDFYVNNFEETSSILKIKTDLHELFDINTTEKEIRKIDTIKLDSIEEISSMEKIDLIKIDVQGAEKDVLLGAEISLAKTDLIFIEVSFKSLYYNSSNITDIFELLYSFGFILVEIFPGHRNSLNELLQANCLFKKNKYE